MTFLQRHAYSIGGAIAAAAWPFFFRRRRISVDNVLKCGITSDPREARRIARVAWRHFAGHIAEALFVPRLGYRTTGVVFFGLEKAGTARQLDLFTTVAAAESSPLYRAVDLLNAKYGAGRVFSASEGVGAKSWAAKRFKLSRRATTRWDELPVVH